MITPVRYCPACGSRLPEGQVGISHGRAVAYCTTCDVYWMIARRSARKASPVEARLARRNLFVRHGVPEPANV